MPLTIEGRGEEGGALAFDLTGKLPLMEGALLDCVTDLRVVIPILVLFGFGLEAEVGRSIEDRREWLVVYRC